MSEPMLGLALVALLAQDPAVLRARVARLERALQAEQAAHRGAPLERDRLAGADTMSAGSLHVATLGVPMADARRGATEAWDLVDATFGEGARALAPRRFTLIAQGSSAENPRQRVLITDPVITTGAPRDVAQRLLWAAATALQRDDSGLVGWLFGSLSPTRDPRPERHAVYVELVTASSPAVQRCYLGEVAACRVVLGFVPAADAVADWYTAARRRAIVQSLADVLEARQTPRQLAACTKDGSERDCLAILRRVPAGAISLPLAPVARHSLLRAAFARGGRGAFLRFSAAAGQPLDARLAAASGVPTDSLIGLWRTEVLGARPRPVTVEPRGAWLALAWGVALALVALRSSRWR